MNAYMLNIMTPPLSRSVPKFLPGAAGPVLNSELGPVVRYIHLPTSASKDNTF